MGTITKCPHCGGHLIIEPALKIDVSIQKLELEAKDNGNGNVRPGEKSSSD